MILFHLLHRIRYEIVALAFIFYLPSIVLAQPFGSSPPLQPVTVIAKHDAYPLRLPAMVRPDEVAVRSSTIQINFNPVAMWGDNCSAWPEAAQTAVQYAAHIWETYLDSNVTITLDACWADNLSVGVLGHGGALNYWYNFSGAPLSNTFYSSSLANSLHGSDLDSNEADMYIGLSSIFSWYTGTDGNTPAGQYDLVSVVLHEICHGLGLLGFMQYSGGEGGWGYGYNMATPYDGYAETGEGQSLLDTALFPNPSYALGTVLTSSNVYFSGPNAMAANSNQPVKLYAPATWSSGSSYSHIDTIYNNTINSLMTYAFSDGASQHNLGPILVGLMEDIGWQTDSADPTPTPTATPSSTPIPGATATPTPEPTATPSPSYSADLSVSITDFTASLLVGSQIEYQAVVLNGGPERAASVVLSSILPEGVNFVSAMGTQGDCSNTAESVNCSLGTLQPSDSVTVTITLLASTVGEKALSVTTVGADSDPDLSNNSTSVQITVGDQKTVEPLADLTGTFLSVNVKKKRVRFSLGLENQGSLASTPCKVKLYISRRARARRSALRKTLTIDTLASGGGATITHTLRSETRLFGKYLVAVLDPRDLIAESDEENNLISVKLSR